MSPFESLFMLGCLVFVLWFCAAIVVGSWRLLGRLFAPAPPPLDQLAEDWEAVRRVTSTPVLLPDGTWQMPVLVWKPCDAPMLANNLEVHDPRAPGHDRANCKHCNAKPNHSGVSYRPN